MCKLLSLSEYLLFVGITINTIKSKVLLPCITQL